MKILVFGSMNIDKVYMLDHLPEKRETLTCRKYEIHVGGKGLNQAVSLAKAGASVFMAGAVGQDGNFLCEFLESTGVNTSLIQITDGYTGHAVIEVDKEGQNQMILFPGANHQLTADYCDEVLEYFTEGDLVLLQYETSQVEYMIKKAHDKGMKVAINPSPFTDVLKDFDYSKVDYLILNEDEGRRITGEINTECITESLNGKLGGGSVILTLGGEGAIFYDADNFVKVPAFKVDAVDTTGAGDTFTGYCLKALFDGELPETALRTASAASAIVVMQSGAAETIPDRNKVNEFLKEHL